MTILAFWPLAIDAPGRHTYDVGTHEDAFKELWNNRKKWCVKFYDIESFILHDAHGLGRFIGNADDFQEDYNNEDIGVWYWCKSLLIPSDRVRAIVEAAE